jgi:manganese/zinc/iron transport system permease protein
MPADSLTLEQIVRTLLLQGGYNTNLVIAGTTLLGIASGIVGTFALLARRSLMADALSHATLPGITIAFLAAGALGAPSRGLPVLLAGAAATGLLSILCIQAIIRSTRLREDAVVGAVLSVFFGAGVVGLSYIQANAPAGSAGLAHLIYGQVATMSAADVRLMAAIAALSIACVLALHKEFALVCFNESFARSMGWPVTLVHLLMMVLVALVTVAALQAVGILLVVAMLIVPPAAARFWTDRLPRLVALSAAIGGVSGAIGSTLSALLPDHPAGAVIVLTAASLFALSFITAPRHGVAATAIKRLALRLRFASEHLLESACDHNVAALTKGDIAHLTADRGWSLATRTLVGWWLIRKKLARRAPGGGLRLTEAGLERGRRVQRNHALWEQYLITYADIAPSHVDWSVDQVEHVLTEQLVAELEARLASAAAATPAPSDGGDRR